MDPRFLPAMLAIRRGDTAALAGIIGAQPDLARSRSSCSHPTLMQCLALDGAALPPEIQASLAESLLAAGSVVDEPLIACGSLGNRHLAAWLLDRGARIDGTPDLFRGWSVIEEALYWGHPPLVRYLLGRGAAVRNLRIAAGIGSADRVEGFFDPAGALRMPDAGTTNYPFGDAAQISSDPADVLGNALVYAALGNHVETAAFLLGRGAAIDGVPPGFHTPGTALHWAAVRGHRPMCDFLIERGADPAIRDPTFDATPARWALEGKHGDLAKDLGGAG